MEAINVLTLWACFGDMYSALRDPWHTDTKSYRAQRSIRFLKTGMHAHLSYMYVIYTSDTCAPTPVAAIAFSTALNSVSDYKHKSWYVHYLVWIVPRMIAQYGDLWRFCTAAIESRNARLKRIGRTCISWRPFQEGKTIYHYIDHRTGEEITREQGYKSSPMEQMLSKMIALQDSWHSDSMFVRPAKLRLQQDLRRRRLKVDFDTEVEADGSMRGMGDVSLVLLNEAKKA